MPNRNVHLTPDLDDFVLTRIESGRYANASELVQAALRALDREEQQHKSRRATAKNAAVGMHVPTAHVGDPLSKLWHAPARRTQTPSPANS
jgi:antitoxin ParD1/3/4